MESARSSLPHLVLVTFGDIEALGSRAIHAYMKDMGANISIVFVKDRISNDVDEVSDAEADILVDLLARIKPDIVGFSFFSALYLDIKKITERIQSIFNVPVIWGGIHATVCPEDSIQSADIICIGEGELALGELYHRITEGKSYTNVDNLWVREGQTIHRNPLRPLIDDLDSLPFFDYEGDNKYYIDNELNVIEGMDPYFIESGRGSYFQSTLVIQTTRGCPFRCTFCAESALKESHTIFRKNVRSRSVDRVIEELETTLKHFPKAKKIAFRDEVFGMNRTWISDFCPKYKEKIGLPFQTSLHPAIVNDELISKLVDAGLRTLAVGIQSGSDRVRKEVFHRKTSQKILNQTFQSIKKAKIKPSYDIITDNFWETQKDREEALDFLLAIPRPFYLRLFSLCFFPGTKLTDRALEERIIQPHDVDGYSRKGLNQWRMTLERERSKEDRLWNSTLYLISKPFIPRKLIRFLYYNSYIKKHPIIVTKIASLSNVINTMIYGLKLFVKGQISISYIKSQWKTAIKINK